ncbi:MAG TPA: SURF1 family protein, partial [Amaricoccus sp.]|nr:SURF1 family protein [Amaricoccus sp.]
VAVLVSLGVWQLRRLEWKRAILAEIDMRLTAAPVAVPGSPDPIADRYLRVRAEGTLRPGEIHVYTGGPGGGVGYRIVAPLQLPHPERDQDGDPEQADQQRRDHPAAHGRTLSHACDILQDPVITGYSLRRLPGRNLP